MTSVEDSIYPHIKQYLEEHFIKDETISPQDLAVLAVKCSNDWKNLNDIEEFLETYVSFSDEVAFAIAFRNDGLKLYLEDL